ncbi:hypothetical protein EJB05_11451, partial [Eragrostis curvula]
MASSSRSAMSSLLLMALLLSCSGLSGAARLLEEEYPHPEVPELPKPELPPHPEVPELPKPELPPHHEVPELPKPELPPHPEVPELPKPELPPHHEVPELPKPELPKPELPHPEVPELPKHEEPHPVVPELPKPELPHPEVPEVPKHEEPHPVVPELPKPELPHPEVPEVPKHELPPLPKQKTPLPRSSCRAALFLLLRRSPPIRAAHSCLPARLRLLLFRRLLTTASPATASSPAPAPTSSAAPKPTDPALLLRLCTVLYQHQNAPDDAFNRRARHALPIIFHRRRLLDLPAARRGREGRRRRVPWLCKEGKWGAFIVFAEMSIKGMEVDGEVMGDLVYELMARRRTLQFHGLMKGLIWIKRTGETTKVFIEMIASGCKPNMHA